ncbi:MAG TPA: SDR family oxidoreductase [Patescibacteria group bacterium]|nr:SDR family oxidoreductase [Patescibacteria group bacterium]
MIVITGASDGVGLQLAKLYKSAGKQVVNISLHDCEYANENIVLDLSKGPEINKAAQQVKKLDGTVEAVINCVGVYSEQKLGEITETEIKKVMSTNVKAPMLLVSLLIERIKKDEADILNMVSTAGTVGKKDNPLYSASKWAERGFTASLKEELKDTQCRVISFCPGGIRTKFFEKALGRDTSQEDWMRPEDIAMFIKQILDLPKNMEVSEVIINRKSTKKGK